MDRYRTPTVSLAEAYHVAQRWLTFLGAVPEQVIEPADGIIELRSAGLVTRIKFARAAVAPSAILAMLKATDGEAVRRLLFSATGFTGGAKQLGESRGIGLFDIDAMGDVHPHTTYARSLVPSEPLEPAFLHTPRPDSDEPEVPTNPFGPIDESDAGEWVDCPRCGVSQHHAVEVCVSCGADMSSRGRALGSPVALGGNASVQSPGPPFCPVAGTGPSPGLGWPKAAVPDLW
jgi:ribosomal protein L37E